MHTMTLLLIARKVLWFIYDLLTLNKKKKNTTTTHTSNLNVHIGLQI